MPAADACSILCSTAKQQLDSYPKIALIMRAILICECIFKLLVLMALLWLYVLTYLYFYGTFEASTYCGGRGEILMIITKMNTESGQAKRSVQMLRFLLPISLLYNRVRD